MIKSVHDIVRSAEQNYITGATTISKYVRKSMYETINTIDAYVNSKHISGSTDSLGREKPFFNIVTAAVNIWYRATDIDRKDIRISASKISDTGIAFIATMLLHDWMKRARFGVFLNDWGRALAKYGSAVVKFVEQDGELIPSVISWNRFIADPIDFDAISHIEKFYKTPDQLRAMTIYNKDAVDALITATTTRKLLDKNTQDMNASNFIEIYEIHGMMDSRLLEDNPDYSIEDKDITYVQQMHVISYVADGKDYVDFCLYKGREKKDPYMITHLIKEDGQTLSIGAVESLFDAQWMQNHSVKNMKDTLDLASKLIFQTSDTTYVGKNVLTAIETGDIFTHAPNMPLTRVANDNPSIVAMMNYRSMWEVLGQQVTSTPDAMRGINPTSGTPWSTTGALIQQGQSLFELMTENKGLAIEDMLRDFIIPFLKTKINHKDEIVAILDANQIAEIDAMYIPNEAVRRHNANVKQAVLQGQIPSPFSPTLAQNELKDQMALQGNKRAFAPDEIGEKTWKEALKDLEWNVDVTVTNESSDKQAVMTTLNTVFQTIASNPYILQNPNAKMIFDAILTETGRISPLQLIATNPPASQQPQTPPPPTLPGSMAGGGGLSLTK